MTLSPRHVLFSVALLFILGVSPLKSQAQAFPELTQINPNLLSPDEKIRAAEAFREQRQIVQQDQAIVDSLEKELFQAKWINPNVCALSLTLESFLSVQLVRGAYGHFMTIKKLKTLPVTATAEDLQNLAKELYPSRSRSLLIPFYKRDLAKVLSELEALHEYRMKHPYFSKGQTVMYVTLFGLAAVALANKAKENAVELWLTPEQISKLKTKVEAAKEELKSSQALLEQYEAALRQMGVEPPVETEYSTLK